MCKRRKRKVEFCKQKEARESKVLIINKLGGGNLKVQISSEWSEKLGESPIFSGKPKKTRCAKIPNAMCKSCNIDKNY